MTDKFLIFWVGICVISMSLLSLMIVGHMIDEGNRLNESKIPTYSLEITFKNIDGNLICSYHSNVVDHYYDKNILYVYLNDSSCSVYHNVVEVKIGVVYD